MQNTQIVSNLKDKIRVINKDYTGKGESRFVYSNFY